jgi:hypothetical protein
VRACAAMAVGRTLAQPQLHCVRNAQQQQQRMLQGCTLFYPAACSAHTLPPSFVHTTSHTLSPVDVWVDGCW